MVTFSIQAERQNAEDLQLALVCSKQKYRMALASLEAISDEVHLQRKLRHKTFDLPPRTPGVGAELDSDLGSELSDMPSASLGLYLFSMSRILHCNSFKKLNCCNLENMLPITFPSFFLE